ncbi:ATP-dependent protease ClpP protease subunit [Streptacidiphilus sp. MAP12-33]|uniref:head maturation protease, ClpP-related n=1 Tax=Streptacidiphilus sp. MAP12-33 TaxID=3156266 RepID=UPI003515B954
MTNVRPLKARISNSGGGVTRVDVYDDIGPGGWFSEGLTAKSFAAQLAEVTGELEVHINSGGGDVFDGLAIKNALEQHKGPVTTVVDGIAASIASVIAQAGTDRVMMPGSMMMIHDASTMTFGNAAELAKTAQTLDEVSNNLAGVYARTAGGTVEDWRAAMQQETWYTADQAVAAGLATRVGTDGGAVLPPGFDPAAYGPLPGRIAAQLRAMPRATPPGSETAAALEAAGVDPAQLAAAVVQQERPQEPVQIGGAKLAELVDGRGFVDLRALADELLASAAAENARHVGRVLLGMESMPIQAKALPVHHTATVDEPWDGPAAVKAMPNDDAVLRYCFAWMSAEAAAETPKEGDDDADDQKASYRFPHHKTKGGPANLAACRNGLGRLEGSKIPDGDKAGVRAHLQAHLDDAKGDDEATNDHAELPHWLRDDTTPVPEWLNTAEEATK